MKMGFPGVLCAINSLIKKIFSSLQVIGNYVYVVKHHYELEQNTNQKF